MNKMPQFNKPKLEEKPKATSVKFKDNGVDEPDTHLNKLLALSEKKPIGIFDMIRAARLDKTDLLKPKIGDMVIFNYVSKGRLEDSKFNSFPMIFILSVSHDRIYGLNMLYLPPVLRNKVILQLTKSVAGLKLTDTTRGLMVANLLKSYKDVKLFAPCFREYKLDSIKSKFINIPTNNWGLSLKMPIIPIGKQQQVPKFKEAAKQINTVVKPDAI